MVQPTLSTPPGRIQSVNLGSVRRLPVGDRTVMLHQGQVVLDVSGGSGLGTCMGGGVAERRGARQFLCAGARSIAARSSQNFLLHCHSEVAC